MGIGWWLFSATGDSESIVIAVESVFLVGAEKMTHEIVEGDETGDFAVAVGDEEEEGIGAKKSV